MLARKPAMLRMIGLMPIVRNKAFDMVSDGQGFKLWIPPKNRFVVGRNDFETHNPSQPLENLRPQHIYDALLLRHIDPENEIAVLENDTELVTEAKSRKVSRADYIVDVIHKGNKGGRFHGRSCSVAPTCCRTASFSTTNREMSRPTRFTEIISRTMA